MGGRWGRRWLAAVAVAGIAGTVTAQSARAPTLRAMTGVQPGVWQLRALGTTAPPVASCVTDPSALLRLRHRTAQCSRFVIDDSAGSATVHYTCPGAGHVRTHIRVDTPRVLKIESEGVAEGSPFADTIEARRTGSCTGGR